MDEDRTIYIGGEVKALGNGRVGGYLVRFTSADEPDLEADYFDADTQFGKATESPVYYNHGLDPTLKLRQLGDGRMEIQDAGVWIEAQLAMRDEYERAVYTLAEAGKLGWSSGTAPHLVIRETSGKAAHIKQWPLGLDASLTPTPADPGNRAMPLKAWAEATKGIDLQVQPEGAVTKTVSAGTTVHIPEGADVQVIVNQKGTESPTSTEGKTMSENTENVQAAEPVDVEAIATAAATRAVEEARKAWLADMANAGPVRPDKAGYISGVTDEADRALAGNGFKGWGDFLQTVAKNPMDKRLLPLREAEGYFNASKAMGDNAIGSLTAAKMAGKSRKAPTGLGELIPSAGGFLVGTDRDNSLLQRVYNVGNLLQRVDMVGISAGSNGMTFNAIDETSRADGSRRGGIRYYWAAEAAEKTASQPKFRQMELKLYKLIGLVYATDELLADASALESWIMQNLPEELAFGAEDAIINGTGAGRPLGILNAGSLVSVAKETGQAATTIVAENISKMWARRWLGGRNYVWLINQDVEPELDNLFYPAGTGGQLVYMPPGGLSGAQYGTIKGRPVIPVEYCPTLGTVGDIILADLSEYQMIEKGGVQSASSIHVRFVYDETVFRFVYRIDGEPKWDQPLTPYQGTNTVSPFVALATRS